MRHRWLVRHGEIDARDHARGCQPLELLERATRQHEGGPTGREVDHAQVAPINAAAKAGAERLGARLLGGVALGVALGAIEPALGARALNRREDAFEEPIAEALDGLFDAADVDEIAADAEDHRALAP